jgi:hypothetical protein
MKNAFVALAFVFVCLAGAACAPGGDEGAGAGVRGERSAALTGSTYETAVLYLRQAEGTLPRLARELEQERDWEEALNEANDLQFSLNVVMAELYMLQFPVTQPTAPTESSATLDPAP